MAYCAWTRLLLSYRTNRPHAARGILRECELKFLLLLASVSVLAGCATWSTSNVDSKAAETNSTTAALTMKTPVSSIQVTDADVVDKKYVSLGDITVNVNKTTLFHPNPTPEIVNERLKEKAYELGADAVILVRYGQGGIGLLSWGSLEGKGRAVRYVK